MPLDGAESSPPKSTEPSGPAPAESKTKAADSSMFGILESVLSHPKPKARVLPKDITREELKCVKLASNLQMDFLANNKVPATDGNATSWMLGTLAAVMAVVGVAMVVAKLYRLRRPWGAPGRDSGHASSG